MAKSFLVSPGRAYLVIAAAGTRVLRTNGTLIDTVPDASNSVSITVDTHEIIVMDNAAKIQQLYNGNSGSNGIMTTAVGDEEGTWKIEIVSALPEEGSPGVIYMVRTTRTGTDRYDDYIWIPEDHAYELLGRRPESSSVDLTNVAKTNEENTFTKGQRITGTLYATKVTTPSIECTDWANFSSLDADIAAIANLSTVTTALISNVSIQRTLHVDADADVRLPGMYWGRGTETARYVQVTIPLIANTFDATTILAQDSLTVSNMFTLSQDKVKITVDGFVMRDGDRSITISDAGIRLINTAAVPDRPVFSVTDLGEVSASVVQALTVTGSTVVADTISVARELRMSADASVTMHCPVVLGGDVSVLDTLTVNNLDVLGSVSGIEIGGGGSQSNIFDSGVSVVGGLTADAAYFDHGTVMNDLLVGGTLRIKDTEGYVGRTGEGIAEVGVGRVYASEVLALNGVGIVTGEGESRTEVAFAIDMSESDTRTFVPCLLTAKSNGSSKGALFVTDCVMATELEAKQGVAINDQVVLMQEVGVGGLRVKGWNYLTGEADETSGSLYVRNVHTSYINGLITDGTAETTASTVRASTMWCLSLGSDYDSPTRYVSLVSPLAADEVSIMNSLKVGIEHSGAVPALDISHMEGSPSSPVATLNVVELNVKALAKEGRSDFNARATDLGLSIKYGDGARMFVGTDTSHTSLYGLYLDPTNNTYTGPGDTFVPTLLVHGMAATEAAIIGQHNGEYAPFAVNWTGVYLDGPARSYHGKDITAIYYNASDTPKAGCWNELFPANNTAMVDVTTLDLSTSTFGLDLSATQLRPTSAIPYPRDDSEVNPQNDVIVSSVEFGFTTGPNGLTVTWPADAVWPDEPNRIPPTQFEPNMCYRFVCRLEPVSNPSTPAYYGTQMVTFKYVRLLSQTYSYPSPWATT